MSLMECFLRAQHFVRTRYTAVEWTVTVPVLRKLQASGDTDISIADSKQSDVTRTRCIEITEKGMPEVLVLEV